jgi:hypothetical protein
LIWQSVDVIGVVLYWTIVVTQQGLAVKTKMVQLWTMPVVAAPIQQIKLRLPIALKRRIDKAAEQSRRSLNGEIIARLEQTFGSEAGTVSGSDLEQRLQSVEKALTDVFERLEKLEAARVFD